MNEPDDYPGVPRWVKWLGIAGALLLLLAILIVAASGGRHGPGRHMTSHGAQP